MRGHDRAQCFRCLDAATRFPAAPPCVLTFVPPVTPMTIRIKPGNTDPAAIVRALRQWVREHGPITGFDDDEKGE